MGGRDLCVTVDNRQCSHYFSGNNSNVASRFNQMPTWRNFYHFGGVMTIAFNDGSKFEALSKVCEFVFVSCLFHIFHYILATCICCPQHFQLLRKFSWI